MYSMSLDKSPEIFFGRKKGTFAPYFNAIFLIFGESVDT